MKNHPKESSNELLSALRKQKLEAKQFCDMFMEIVANTDNVDEDLLDDSFYNHIFDLCVQIEDGGDDAAWAEVELRAVAAGISEQGLPPTA